MEAESTIGEGVGKGSQRRGHLGSVLKDEQEFAGQTGEGTPGRGKTRAEA